MKILTGNIFSTNCQTIVNTVNCVGVMGAGLAYEARLRYPEMYLKYLELCNNNLINIGTLWIYKNDQKWILNFPTKFHWKYESKPEYLEKGLKKFIETYKIKGIESIAFPILGSSNGGIPEDVSLSIMKRYLDSVDIPVEVYKYDPLAYDDLFLGFKKAWKSLSEKEIKEKTNLRIDLVRKVNSALDQDDLRSLSRLLTFKGIGEVTLEKAYQFMINNSAKIDQS